MGRFVGIQDRLEVCGFRGLQIMIAMHFLGQQAGFNALVKEQAHGASLLEIGGPSDWFRRSSAIPIYGLAGSVDNVNYAEATLWEGRLLDGDRFAPEGRALGSQWLREASTLGLVGPYHGVVSSHTIEHLANPLGGLREWLRVTRTGGFLFLVLPHRDGTFDHRRPVTPLAHLRDDERSGVSELDRSHFNEILCLHDIERDPGIASRDELVERLHRNGSMRAAHHHVYDTRAALEMVRESGWSPVAAQARWPHDILILARKIESARDPLRHFESPFPSDRPDRCSGPMGRERHP